MTIEHTIDLYVLYPTITFVDTIFMTWLKNWCIKAQFTGHDINSPVFHLIWICQEHVHASNGIFIL